MNDYISLYVPGQVKDRSGKRKLRRETFQWQKAAIRLLAVSLAVNMAQYARIIGLEDSARTNEALRQADAAFYEKRIEQAQRERDFAIEELVALTASVEADKRARAEQARAYEAAGEYTYAGTFQITYYCPCSKCCSKWADGLTATGIPAGPGIVAVDPSVIELGSTVIIDGQKYLAADTGVTGNHVDICVMDHDIALDMGTGKADVWVVRND